ncbi:MAG: hypothetical protein ACI4SM_01720 [Candidatus Gastranaerophilaceae bacterium]
MFKKSFLSLVLISALSLSASASDMSTYCASPHDLSLKGTQILTNVTGMTLLTQAVANSIVKSELKKSTGANGFKVKMKSFSAKDLVDGRFKSLNITGKNLNFDGVYVSEFNANTVCNFNYIKATRKNVYFKDNFVMNYNMTVSDSDLRKTVLSKDYLSVLKSLNLKTYGLNLFELKDVDVKLKNDKFYFTLKMNNKIFNMSLPLNVELSTKMIVENNKIKVSEVAFENLNQKINLSQVTNLLNLINPLNFTVDVMGNKNTKLSLNDFVIKGDKINLSGTVFVPKNAVDTLK